MEGGLKILLLLVVAAPLLCRGNVENCRGVDGFTFPPENQTSFVSYMYAQLSPGVGCDTVTQQCFATVPNERLRQRTWYIDDTKSSTGFGYKPFWIQIYNIQCPPDTVLHIVPLVLSTEPGDDFITVDIPGRDGIILSGGTAELENSPAYDDGFGIVAEGGNASISFCSNGNTVVDSGFALRATCIDLSHTCLPGCVEFNSATADISGGEFIDRILRPFQEIEKANIPHKRDAKNLEEFSSSLKQWGTHPDRVPEKVAHTLKILKSGKLNRQKRFINGFLNFELTEGQTVTYIRTNQLIVDFNNGSTLTFTVGWLVAVNSLIGTRIFDIEAPPKLIFGGPGRVEIFNGLAIVDYTIDSITDLVTPCMMVTEIINTISRFIYNSYIRPFPITCPAEDQSNLPPERQSPPLPLAAVRDSRWRAIFDLGFIQPDIQSGSCVRSAVPSLVPSRTSLIEEDIFDFCRFFSNSCDPLVRAVCAEAVGIDRVG